MFLLGKMRKDCEHSAKKKVVQVVCEHPPRFMGKNNMKLNDSEMYHQYSHRNLT